MKEIATVRPDRPALMHPTVIINADDWGRSIDTTNRILDCAIAGSLSSVSAMVFMVDSERAANLARAHAIDAGLHLNFTLPFNAFGVSPVLIDHQQKIARFLRISRFAPAVFNPLLTKSFAFVVKAQIDEFERLYGLPPRRVDGHHHMHLCANVLRRQLIPAGVIVRRNFSFHRGEKNSINLLYRRRQDRKLARRHPVADFFFNLATCDSLGLQEIARTALHASVEIEAHPAIRKEFDFLLGTELRNNLGTVAIAKTYDLSKRTIPFAPVSEAPSPQVAGTPHICVCICTYKRPQPLKRLLLDLLQQATDDLFTYSIVVADNDEIQSAETIVREFESVSRIPVKYCVQPIRGISMARNKVIENAHGDYLALIDDDEFPSREWLVNLYRTCIHCGVDGVLGPVRRHFDQPPPSWLGKSRLYDRAVNPTGLPVQWRQARTGNALLRREIFQGDTAPFRPEFRAGEDQDFFRRKIEEGRNFIWSADAEVFEVLPPARWKRMYYVRKALLQGANAAQQPDCGPVSIMKSMIAVALYTIGLPFALLAGQHRFMTLLVKLCDHLGKLLFLLHLNPIREEYVSD
jgi:predicted glycoside hydrolase/deacetylase ChbG (UPF0249 family)